MAVTSRASSNNGLTYISQSGKCAAIRGQLVVVEIFSDYVFVHWIFLKKNSAICQEI